MHKVYGLIGYPLKHSFSPAYFKDKFTRLGIDATYHAYAIPTIHELPELIKKHPSLAGLNVTIPYKEQVLSYLDEVDSIAQQIGAVNCIAIHAGKLKGYNTDVIGFADSLKPLLQPHHTDALILGTGGASLAVAYALGQLGIRYTKVSRAVGDIVYADLRPEHIATHTLIINTTPVGMFPDVDAFPDLPYEAITDKHLLYDLIYNPAETAFLAKGKAQGATIKNGHEMLVLQAEASWQIWNDYMPTV
ncbi:MAG TPA: shikimate dehydrogenase [Flavipsychrobacter sp.]